MNPNAPTVPGASPLLLLDADAMSELYKHVSVKVCLRLTCRAAKAGHPDPIKAYISDAVANWPSLQLAFGFGLDTRKFGDAILRHAVKGGHL